MKVKVRRISVTIPVSADVAKDLAVILPELFAGSELTVSVDADKGLVTIERKKKQVPNDA